MFKITEACGCGTMMSWEIAVVEQGLKGFTDVVNLADAVVSDWREKHKHFDPVIEEEEDDEPSGTGYDHDVSSSPVTVGFIGNLPNDLPVAHKRVEWDDQ